MEGCQALAEVLNSDLCFLIELDLSNNRLQDSGVEELTKGLKSQRCNLKALRYSNIYLFKRCTTSIEYYCDY